MISVFEFNPIRLPAGAIRPIAPLRHEALQPPFCKPHETGRDRSRPFERSDENAVGLSRHTISALYNKVYADPANKAVVARAHRRPTASSTSGSELQRDDELKLAIASRVVVAA